MLVLLLNALLLGLASGSDELQGEDPDSRKPYQVAVITSSQEGSISTTIEAIKRFLEAEARDINRAGGISGTPIKLVFYDDNEDAEQTKAKVEEALGEERLIAMLGLWSSSRGAGVLDLIGRSGVPFISEISLDQLFRSHDNIFTLTTSVSDDTQLFRRFLAENFSSVQFVGVNDDLFTLEFHQALDELKGTLQIMDELWVDSNNELSQSALDEIIAAIRERQPSIICMAAGSFRGSVILQALAEADIDTPVYFATGTIQRVLRNLDGVDYRGALYQNSTDIPFVENERLAQIQRHPEFISRRIDYSNDDLAYGFSYADMLAMIADAAKDAPDLNPTGLRSHISSRLREIKAGQQFYEGVWRNWAFTKNRAVSQDKLLHWRPKNSQDLKLFPTQYQAKPTGLSQVPVVYLNIDMEQIRSVDSMEKTFDADFYISMTSNQEITLDDFEFTNAYRSSGSGAPLISNRNLKTTQIPGSSEVQRLYKVSGRFLFDPDLGDYPFDEQRFSISFQPTNTTSPFLIQPPPPTLREDRFDIDGWTLSEDVGYVGTEEDIISTFQDYGSGRSILAFHKFNFTWTAQRYVLDYYLRVVIPLALIMVVAYFSVFIPNSKFDSVIAIQVTALLSTIALYLAIPKMDSETATMSDQIFLFTEAVIGLMIAFSILRVNIPKRLRVPATLIMLAQVITVPVLVLLMVRYVWMVQVG
tara:strand:- start:3759 stop:5861 length:2103 start_codon:yes stop_codon:yes gene_type:complete